jgi:outer membrane protein assembly factor BamB
VAGEGIVLGCTPKGGPVFAVALGQEGTLPENGFAWKSAERLVSSDVSTPLFYRGHFYVMNSDRKALSKVEPKTGRVLWTGELEGRDKIEASPTAADGRIYFMDFRGKVTVVDAGDEFKILHQASMGDEGDNNLRSSVAISGGNLFVRTGRKLYAIGGSQ